MNIIYKYSLDVPLADVAATNDANAATGFGAGGAFEGAIMAFSAVGGSTAITVAAGVGVIPSTNCTITEKTVITKLYDINLTGAGVVAGNHVYKLPLKHLNIDNKTQRVTTVFVPNTYDLDDGDLLPVSDRFFAQYKVAQEAIFIGFPNADVALYNGRGIKLVVQLEALIL